MKLQRLFTINLFIAAFFGLSCSIFSKLGVSDRTAAVTSALQRGILHLEP
jgi:hypothetical protein